MPSFAEGFAEGKQQQKQSRQLEEFRKAQKKMLDAQIDLQQLQLKETRKSGEARESFFSQFQPSNAPQGIEGPPQQPSPGKGFLEVLADPEGQLAGLRSGVVSPKDILMENQRGQTRALLEKLTSGGAGGTVEPISGIVAAQTGDITQLKADPNTQKLNAPLSPTEMLNFKPKGGQFPRTLKEAQNFELQAPDQRKLAQDMRGAQTIMQNMSAMADKVFVDKGLIGRLSGKARNQFKSATQSDPNLLLFQSLKDGTKSLIVRALGEKGALAEGDIERIDKLFPKTGLESATDLPDTREIATKKLQQIDDIINGIINGTYSNLNEAISGVTKSKGKDDLSNMTDEELRAIINGRP